MLLDLGALTTVRDWSPRDGVMIVEPAVAVADAEARVGADERSFADDWPCHARGTFGASAAIGRMTFDRPGPAGPRWSVIGMKGAHPDGTTSNHGARVAKNVAGLDLTRLHVGALGTLGVIVELMVRTRPAAAVRATATAAEAAPCEVEMRVPPPHLARFLEQASLGADAALTSTWTRAANHTGGALRGFEPRGDASLALAAFRHWLAEARELARALGGYVLVTRAPSEWKHTFDVWGDPPQSIALMRKLRALYDPTRVLNPGRFVGGL